MSTLNLTLQADETNLELQQLFQKDANRDRETALALSQYFQNLASGVSRAHIDVQTSSTDPVAASATFELDSIGTGDWITIGTDTFYAQSSPANENQFQVGGTDAEDAQALADTINAHSIIGKVVLATADSNIVTVTALQKGVIGNQIVITENSAAITASGTHLSGGTGGSTDEPAKYSLGLKE